MRFIALIAIAVVFAGDEAMAQETTDSTAKNTTSAVIKEVDE